MRLSLLFALFLFACSSSTQTAVIPTTPAQRAQNVENVMQAVVMLGAYNLSDDGWRVYCSGVYWKTYIVTASHCVDEDTTIEIKGYRDFASNLDATPDFYRLRRRIDKQDLALLEPIWKPRRTPSPVTFADRDPYAGERIFVIGHSFGSRYPYMLSEGRVAPGLRVGVDLENGEEQLWFAHSAESVGGNSGGPILTEDGLLLGITSFGPRGFSYPSGAIHPRAIRQLLAGL